MYLRGEGRLERDADEAIRLLTLSVAQGEDRAKAPLAEAVEARAAREVAEFARKEAIANRHAAA